MRRLHIPEIVRTRAGLRGDEGLAWLDGLPALTASLAQDWDLELGSVLGGGTDALVMTCRTHDHQEVVLKVMMPGLTPGNDQVRALLAFAGAVPYQYNGFKIALGQDTLVRVLNELVRPGAGERP